jgi:Flp pilus assembly protein CpaB
MEPLDIRKRLRSRQGASGALPPPVQPISPAVPPPASRPPAAPPPGYTPSAAEPAPGYAPPRYGAGEPAAAEPTPAYTPPRYQAPEAPPPPPQAAPAKQAKGPKLKGEVNKRMLILALGCAAVASLLIVNYVRSSAGVLAQQSKLIKVATVAKDIPARTVVTKDMVTFSELPALYVPKGTATPEDTVIGKVALTALYAGEPIHTKRLSDPNAETGLAVKIPNGHRAMAIQNRLAGLVKPGDYVDVFAIVNDKGGKPLTLPVLQRSLVLAVGAKVSATDTNTSGMDSANTASLAVPDQKVDLMTLLEEKGNFRLVLRAPNDTSVLPAKYKDKQLIEMILGAEPPAVRPKPAAPKPAAPVVHHEPVYRPAAPVRAYTPPVHRPAAPRPAAPKPQRQVTVTVINGGNVQQQSQ